MDLKPVGVFAFLDGLTAAQTLDFARKVEALRYAVFRDSSFVQPRF
jgi:hypothetical protein